MTKKFKIGQGSISFTFRHIWEEDRTMANYEVWKMRKKKELGLWFEKNKVVGSRKGSLKATFNKDNHVNSYRIGLRLIVCHMWVTIRFSPILILSV